MEQLAACSCDIKTRQLHMKLSCKLQHKPMPILVILIACVLLAGCQSYTAEATAQMPIGKPYDSSKAPHVETHDDRVLFSFEGTHIGMALPHGWEAYSTEYGVVVAEQIGSVAARGQLDGLLAYVFLTPLENYPQTVATHSAKNVLDLLVTDTDYVGEAAVSPTVAFSWNGHDAAYYLLRDPQSNALTMGIGVVLTEQGKILTCTISAPPEDEGRIREMLPELFGSLTLNGIQFTRDALDALPEVLEFPD